MAKKRTGKPRANRMKKKDADGNETRYYNNILKLDLEPGKLEDKLSDIRNWEGKKDVDYYLDKEELFPRAYQIIIETSKGKETYQRSNKLSDPDKAVTINNIKKDILEKMIDYQDNYFERLEEYGEDDLGDSDWVFNPKKISSIYIRFIYAPKK